MRVRVSSAMEAPVVVRLGLAQATVRVGEHIAYFWESEREFEHGVAFLTDGLNTGDCAVVFGHDEANRKVCDLIERAGFPVKPLISAGRLIVLGPEVSGDATLQQIGKRFKVPWTETRR